MLKVVIIGYGEMFTNLIAGSLDANCDIVGVFRREMVKYNPFIRKIKDILFPSLDYNYIKSYNLHEIHAGSVNSKEFKKALLRLNPDIILVGSWGERISKDIYNLPKIAAINAHPSLLPKYRGPNPYFWVIRNQETTTGISFHLIDDDYDTGAILAQEEIKIFPSDTGKTLKDRVVLTARGVVCELLKDLSEDIIIPLTQLEEKSTYYSHPCGFELDFSKSAEENYALIRASYPWQNAYFYNDITCLAALAHGSEVLVNTTYYTEPKTITNVDIKNKTIDVVCGDGKILRIKIDHYKKYDRPFIRNYMKRDLKVGEPII